MTVSVPAGVGFSQSNLIAGQASRSFTPILATADQGGPASATHIVSFQPNDVNDPGVLTLADSAGTVILTMNTEGLETFVPSPGVSYTFQATKGAQQVSAIMPSVWR